MPASRRRTKPCDTCKARHLKCDEAKPCSNCKEADVECSWTPSGFRFRKANKPKHRLSFSSDQTWLATPTNHVSFVNQTNLLAGSPTRASASDPEDDETPELNAPEPSELSHSDMHQGTVEATTTPSWISPAEETLHQRPLPPSPSYHIPSAPSGLSPSLSSANAGHDLRSPSRPRSALVDAFSPGSVIGSTTIRDNDLVFGAQPHNIPHIGRQEACLLRHFTDKLAHSFDATDRDSHFSITVPQRAMVSPVLFYAICTASARHLTRLWYLRHPNVCVSYKSMPLPDLNDDSAIHYHNICLELLLRFSNDPATCPNEDALAAATILRFYEQLDTSLTGLDSEAYQKVVRRVIHNGHLEALYSTQNVQNPRRDADLYAVPSAGLHHSACLIALQQEIWSVLLYRRPFQLPLSSTNDYTDFSSADDFLLVNRIIVWCADIVRLCFGPDTPELGPRPEHWDALQAFSESWEESRPPCFAPILYEAPDPSSARFFPTIWYMNDCQIIGMQYLELGRMLLAVYNPRRQRLGIGATATNRAVEAQLRDSVLRLCGLALPRKEFQSAMVTAAVGISIGGECLTIQGEQAAIIEFMDTLEEEHAWPVQTVVDALREEWHMR